PYVAIGIAALLLVAVGLPLVAPRLAGVFRRGELVAKNDETEELGVNAAAIPETAGKTNENAAPTIETEADAATAASSTTNASPAQSPDKVAAAPPLPMPVIPAIPDSPETAATT